jgi:hypothetical protein
MGVHPKPCYPNPTRPHQPCLHHPTLNPCCLRRNCDYLKKYYSDLVINAINETASSGGMVCGVAVTPHQGAHPRMRARLSEAGATGGMGALAPLSSPNLPFPSAMLWRRCCILGYPGTANARCTRPAPICRASKALLVSRAPR